MINDNQVLSESTQLMITLALQNLEDEQLFDIASILLAALSDLVDPSQALGAIADVLKIIQKIELRRSGIDFSAKLKEITND